MEKHYLVELAEAQLVHLRRALFFRRDYICSLEVTNISDLRELDQLDELLRGALRGPPVGEAPIRKPRKRRRKVAQTPGQADEPQAP